MTPLVGKVLVGVALLMSYPSDDNGGSDQGRDQVPFPLVGGVSRPRPTSSGNGFQRYSGRSDREDLKIAWMVGYDSVMEAFNRAGQSSASALPTNLIGQAATNLGNSYGENLAKARPAEQPASQASPPTTSAGPSIKTPQSAQVGTGPTFSDTPGGRSHPQVEIDK